MPENSLYLNDLLKLKGIDPKEVKLIRHSLSHNLFRKCYEKYNKDLIKEYTSIQKDSFAKGFKYWMVFISGAGTSAKYLCTYKMTEKIPIDKAVMSSGFPCPEMYSDDGNAFFRLEETDILKDMKDRLIIEWGKGTLSWAQNCTDKNNKPVIAIQSPHFAGYDELILSFAELSDIVNDQIKYSESVSALKNIKAVYLITDKRTGKQYVGSAYGNDGLFGRWAEYVQTRHGGNKLLIRYLKENPKGYESFQFSILQIFSVKATNEEIIACDTRYKNKLMTLPFGWNDN